MPKRAGQCSCAYAHKLSCSGPAIADLLVPGCKSCQASTHAGGLATSPPPREAKSICKVRTTSIALQARLQPVTCDIAKNNLGTRVKNQQQKY